MAGETKLSAMRYRQQGRWGRLIGFITGRALITITGVDPPSILAGAAGFIDVTVPGVRVSQRTRVVMIPPTNLEAGLVITTTPITADNTVRINLLNTTGSTIDGASRTWTARVFSMFYYAGNSYRTPGSGALAAASKAPTRLPA